MTTTTKPKPTTKPTTKTRSARGRAGVPAVEADPGTSTSVVDALAARPPQASTSTLSSVSVVRLHPHPHNPRRDPGDLTELTASIRAHGVRQNLLVVPDPDHEGEFRIVIGRRRWAAAGLAGLTHVPAVIDPGLDEADQLQIMLLENLQRSDLTPIEEAAGYQGLLDLGVGARAIAKRTGRSEKTVTARLRLLTLPETAREKVHTYQATLDDAAALASFDGDEDLREQLTDKFGVPGFAHALERARVEAKRRRVIAALRAELEAAGVTVVDAGGNGGPPKGVTRLLDLKGMGKDPYASLSEAEHVDCPGRVAWIPATWGTPTARHGCRDAAKHGHESHHTGSRGTADRGPMSEQEKAECRALVANNKAALAAETVRRAWLEKFLQRTRMPADAPAYVARIFNTMQDSYCSDVSLASSWLGIDRSSRTDVDTELTTPARAMVYLVALAAARVENAMPKDYHRGSNHSHLVHLTALAPWGYELAEVEADYIARHTKKTRAKKTPTATATNVEAGAVDAAVSVEGPDADAADAGEGEES